jgi:hypothetical protein
VSNPAHPPEDQQRFALIAQPPLRAYLIASISSLGGGVLIVLWMMQDWPLIVGVLASLLLLFGLALSGATLLLTSRFKTTLVIDRDTVTLINGRRRRVLNWTEVADVSLHGSHLIFTPKGEGKRAVVPFDARRTDRHLFDDLLATVRSRLDASRGYRP